MLRGRIQLVTPVPGSKRWPLGYRILGERFFKTAGEFRAGLESLIDAHMSIGMPSDRPLRFRADLKYSPGDKSFTLQSRGAEHTINDAAGAVSIGELIARGAHTASQLITQAATAGADILLVADLIDQLFDAGLLEEDFDDTFAERQNEGMIMRAAALERAMAGAAPHAGPA